MRLSIFSRVMLAQSTLIALILVVSLYGLAKLHIVSRLNIDVLTVDAQCINEEKRLLQSFLAEMRNGEKYLLTLDGPFHEEFTKSRTDFDDALSKIAALITTDRERALLSEIGVFHNLYFVEIESLMSGNPGSEQVRSRMTEGIIERANELLQLREQQASTKTEMSRDHATNAAEVMLWLTLFGIAGALFQAFRHARGVSSPLKELSEEMRHVGRGEFNRSVMIKGPREVEELAAAFRNMAEELEHLDRLKADFTAHVSHELRTPLTAIREGTALLLEGIPGPLTSNQREILEIVRNHSQRLSHSITSILDLSKMEAEMMDYEFAPCDLGTVMENSVRAVDLIARKREIDIQITIDRRIPVLVADERRVQQVMDNLLSNALKFSPEGGKIRIEAFMKGFNPQQAREVEIRVYDNGPGIPKGEIKNIFKHFYQSTTSKSKGGQGTGLGLAIARHIIEAHKGKIWAESELGSGSVFCFTLPMSSSVEPLPVSVDENSPKASSLKCVAES